MQKKLLILNGSHSDIPLIEAGKELGYHVITTGNLPKLVGHAYGDEYHMANFSDKEEILSLATSLKIDAICACANDFGALTAAYVAEKLGLGGHDPYETALILHHKDKFKAFSKVNHIQTPPAESFDDLQEALKASSQFEYPLIIKPIDLTGGKGVTKVLEPEFLEEALQKAFNLSRVKKVVVEKFLVGTYHSFSTFLVNKKVASYFSDNELSYLNPFLVSTSAGPATALADVEAILVSESEKIASLLNLVDGVFHIQYILSEGRPYIIEITRRCSGDFYPLPVTHATGIPWAKWIVKAECGHDCQDFPVGVKQEGFCGRHCIMGPKNGVVANVLISEEIKNNIYDSFLWWHEGDTIDNYLVDKLGVVFLKYDSMAEMMAKATRLNEWITVQYQD